MEDPKIKQCVIEVVKDHCPACFRSKQNTNMISRKMHLHGIYDQIPIFRMKISNQIPQLGSFPHSPLHLFIKKEGNEISEIKLLKTPIPQSNTDEFIKQLEEHGNIPGLSSKIKIDVMAHGQNYYNMKDLENDYNFEFDTEPGYISLAERHQQK